MKMLLKCKLCGAEYSYDSEICHACEEKAINSNLRSQDGDHHKWRCDTFLESNRLAFGCNLDKSKLIGLKLIECPDCGEKYSYGRHILHNCKDNSISFGKIFEASQRTYRWNCNTAMACLDTLTSEIESIETIVERKPHREKLGRTDYKWNEISTVQYKNIEIERKNGPLIYE